MGSDISKFLGGRQAASTQTLSLVGNVGGTLSSPKVKLNMEKTLGSAVNLVAGQLLSRLSGTKSTSSHRHTIFYHPNISNTNIFLWKPESFLCDRNT